MKFLKLRQDGIESAHESPSLSESGFDDVEDLRVHLSRTSRYGFHWYHVPHTGYGSPNPNDIFKTGTFLSREIHA